MGERRAHDRLEHPSSFELGSAIGVCTRFNDREEITALGKLPNGDTHAFLLIPCDENHSDGEGCEDAAGSTTVAIQNSPAPISQSPVDVVELGLKPRGIAARFHDRLSRNGDLGAWSRK